MLFVNLFQDKTHTLPTGGGRVGDGGKKIPSYPLENPLERGEELCMRKLSAVERQPSMPVP